MKWQKVKRLALGARARPRLARWQGQPLHAAPCMQRLARSALTQAMPARCWQQTGLLGAWPSCNATLLGQGGACGPDCTARRRAVTLPHTHTHNKTLLLRPIHSRAPRDPQDSKNLRRGKGKMRNRRYVQRKGPLVIYGNDAGIRCGAAPGLRASYLPLGYWQQLPCGCRAALGTRGTASGIWRVHAAESCPPGALAAWLCCQMRQVAPSPSCPASRCRPTAAARPVRPPRSRAFRNLPGVELCSVDRLNLLQLAPGGHLGRFCVWTKSAVEKLDSIFGGCCRCRCRHLARPQAGGPRCMPSAACPALLAACSWLQPTARRCAVPLATRTRAAARPATTLHPASSAADARLETPRPAGTTETESAQKKGYKLPRHIMANGDLARLINSDEVQSVVKPHKSSSERAPLKKNPLRNLGAMLKLNPYAKVRCRHASRRPRPASPVGPPPRTPPPAGPCDAPAGLVPRLAQPRKPAQRATTRQLVLHTHAGGAAGQAAVDSQRPAQAFASRSWVPGVTSPRIRPSPSPLYIAGCAPRGAAGRGQGEQGGEAGGDAQGQGRSPPRHQEGVQDLLQHHDHRLR